MTDKEQVDHWLALLGERPLHEGEREAFQDLLRRSPDALDAYLDHCEIETWLAAAGDTIAQPFAPVTAGGATVEKVNRSARSGLLPWLAAAACVGLLMGAGLLLKEPASPDEAILVESALKDEAKGDSAAPLLANAPTAERDPWKVINATGSVKHPGLTETAMPKPASANRPIKFNRDIRPILSETCFHCHGPDEHGRRADLRLDSFAGATADLGGSKAITPGDLDKSEAWWRIVSDDPDELMPPPESHLVLTDEQKSLLKRWIEEGAEYEGHWAYVAPVSPTLPAATGEWGKNEIDRFILARLEEEGMRPAPEADPRALVRRLHLDLTGLPPTVKEVTDFVADYETRGEDAWQDVITRLLASPHYGERLALAWLDQARYADTNGYSIDGGRDMWIWRDWVIQAYNTNLPFDRFTVEQIAGDLLPNATEAQKVATGFNRNHMITHEGGTIPEENLANYTADRVKTTSEVFLGLTMACAQCHDHKYDPISIKEYYEFFAFFNELGDRGLDGNGGNNAAPKIMAHSAIPDDELPGLQARLAELKAKLATTEDGFDTWLEKTAAEEKARGAGFAAKHVEILDASTPNRAGDYEVRPDGSVFLSGPSGGLNAFSHAIRLPELAQVNGIRIHFVPTGDGEKLTPHPDGVPKVTTVLVSAGDQPAKQVDYHRQLSFSAATASSWAEGHAPAGVLDERNLQWWQPTGATTPQHLTVTFDEPVDPAEAPFLSVMIFYGTSDAMPYHWRIEAFGGNDTDSRFSATVAAALAKPAGEWTAEERNVVLAAFREDAPSLERLRVEIANLSERVDVLTKPHQTMVMDVAAQPRETHVLDRGQYDVALEKVSANTPRILPALTAGEKANRLNLANWMVDARNPLTARVAVNRLWALFFGTGIVATTADFGSQGEWPSHPELLDWLATSFVGSGWDQKALIRTVVSSAAYRQDSSASPEQRDLDPRNRLVGRGPRFRLPAEFIRDQALAHSGLLVPRIGGPSVHPYQPAGLWKEVSHFGSTPATSQVFVQDKGEKLYRRSLYTYVKRTSPHPSLSAFDAPNREMCITERGVTNTPTQSLVTLNDPQFAEAARVFAAKLLKETAGMDDQARLRAAFETVTSRLPRETEINSLTSFLTDEKARYAADMEAALGVVSVGEWPREASLDPAEQATWAQVSALLFNLSETLTRF
jgi:hypothetical protein